MTGSVYAAFGETVKHHPDEDFLCILPETAGRYAIESGTYSYRQAAQIVGELRGRYAAAGLRPGQRAGLLLENRPDMFFHWFALNGLGVSVVPINSEWRQAELEFLVGHSEIGVAVAPRGREQQLRQAAADCGRRLIVTPPDLSGLSPAPEAREAARISETQEVALASATREAAPARTTECALLYTSGTTGRPKGCVLTNEYFLCAGDWYINAGGLCTVRPGRDRLLTPLPMTHMNAMAFSTLAMVLTGGCIVPLDRFHPGTWWSTVRLSRATIVHYLGVMPAMLLSAPPESGDRQHTVRFGFGAGVSPRLHAGFEARFGFPLLEAWAMTETGAGAVIIANREPRKVGTACFGRAASDIDYRIVTDHGGDAPVGEPGELWVRARGAQPRRGFFREYLKDSPATEAAWEGGYFHTGDIVFVDPDGDLHFVDRKKNVIRRSGENISAVEVESVILQHPQVAGVGVTAVPDEIRGDEVMACVIARPGLGAAAHMELAVELVEFCKERLAYFKAPGYVVFCRELPLTPTAKIQRARLKELGRTMLGASDAIDLRHLKKRSTP